MPPWRPLFRWWIDDTDLMEIRPIADAAELSRLAEFAAALQNDPSTRIVYLASEADAITDELTDATWDVSGVVAVDGDAVAGWLIGDVDAEMGRVWWLGPYAVADNWEAVADRLLDAARDTLPAGVGEEEMAVDERFERYRTWAVGRGMTEEVGSLVLTLDGPIAPSTAPTRAITEADRDVVATLHDELFPGTHTTGHDLIESQDATHRRLVVDHDGQVAGYVAVELQADGTGYIDFVGVAPTARRNGLGAELVRAGVAELRRLGASSVGLTVRVDSEGARELYGSLGFDEERVAVPLRRGFSLS